MKKNARGRLLAGAGMAAMMASPIISFGHDVSQDAIYNQDIVNALYNTELVDANTNAALSDLFTREAATLSGVRQVMAYDGISHDRARMEEISRSHSWALVDYLEDLKEQCHAPLADDCAAELKEKILGVFDGYDASASLKHYDTVRLNQFDAMLKGDPIVRDMVQNWDRWDVVSRRAGLEHVGDLLARAYSDEDVSFNSARVDLLDIPDNGVLAYYVSHQDNWVYDPHIAFRANELAAMDLKTAMNLTVHESAHHLRQMQMFMLKDQQFDGFFLKHGIRNDIRLLEIAAYELPVQYRERTENGYARWHGMNPAEKDVMIMAAKTDKFFAQMAAELQMQSQAHLVNAPANKMVNVVLPMPRPSWRN